jgi:hypothetical protein
MIRATRDRNYKRNATIVTLGFIEMHMHLHPHRLNIHEAPSYNKFENVAQFLSYLKLPCVPLLISGMEQEAPGWNNPLGSTSSVFESRIANEFPTGRNISDQREKLYFHAALVRAKQIKKCCMMYKCCCSVIVSSIPHK